MVFAFLIGCQISPDGTDLTCQGSMLPNPLASVEMCEDINARAELALMEQGVIVVESQCVVVGEEPTF